MKHLKVGLVWVLAPYLFVCLTSYDHVFFLNRSTTADFSSDQVVRVCPPGLVTSNLMVSLQVAPYQQQG